jgi:hypothetical protein
MALKDHPLFFVITASAACASAAWIVSEKIRVDPLESKLIDQENYYKDSPVIQNITITKYIDENMKEKFINKFRFSDPQGDAKFLNLIVLYTNAKGEVKVRTSSINNPIDEQKVAATVEGKWDCGDGGYYVNFRAIITDAAGHLSKPYDYDIVCDPSK